MKTSKWLCTLLCTLLFCAMPVTAFAAELDENTSSGSAIISAQVPSSHTLTVNADGAIVYVGGAKVENGVAQLNRQSEPRLLISAESGRKIVSVTLDGEDITAELKRGRYTLPKVITEHTLTVTTAEETIPSAVTYTVTGTVRQSGKPLSGITLELRSELKTVVTGDDGTFRFEKVESGHHSLTALKDGKVVGYAEFTLSGGSVNLDYTVAEDGTVNISVPDNTATVNLGLDLTEDNVLQIKDVQATEGSTPGNDEPPADDNAPQIDDTAAQTDDNAPQTGDSSRIWLWLALLTFSCGVLTMLTRKRKEKEAK